MPSVITNSPAETEALGERWGREAQRGWVFALTGELGAGKTQLVKGLARGLGVTARVHSPTFTLVNPYGGGRLTLFHLDLYRIESAEQFRAAGLEEFLQPDGVTVIEWAERLGQFGLRNGGWGAPGGPEALWRAVTIEILGPTQRRISYEDSGA
jgi:tRNA threonylcarbamoyladenosine biosynthesis protein TsaE